jgi:hypothetical protein
MFAQAEPELTTTGDKTVAVTNGDKTAAVLVENGDLMSVRHS